MTGAPSPNQSAMLDRLPHLFEKLAGGVIAAGVAVIVALVLHAAVFAVMRRFARLSAMPADDLVVSGLKEPLRWDFIAVAVSLAGESDAALAHVWESVSRFVVPALLGWTAFALVKAFAAALESRAELSSDELAARSRRTRIAILSRSMGFVIVFVTVALMLLGIPGVRNVGVTLMASAGLAGLAVGAAAQPALKSLIAGIQMALTEPIRLGDLVVIDGESGRIEEIRLTYVVIRTGDERRLIVPMAKFLDSTFQNWTRVSGGITGSVVLPIRPCHPIAPIRAQYEKVLAARPEWDRRTAALQVNEVRVDAVEIRLMMSARNPSALADLRFAVREAMIEWLREEMPEAMCAAG